MASINSKKANRHKFQSLFLILVLCILVFITDVYLYCPFKNDLGLPLYDRGISLGPAITEKQMNGLLWLESQISQKDYIITHIQFWSNVLFIFSEFDKISFYNSDSSGYGSPPADYIINSYHIVSRDSDYYKSVNFFSNITDRIFILLPLSYDGNSDKILNDLTIDPRFHLAFTNDDLKIFVFYPKYPTFSLIDPSEVDLWVVDNDDQLQYENFSLVGNSSILWNLNALNWGWHSLTFNRNHAVNVSNVNVISLIIKNSGEPRSIEIRVGTSPIWENYACWTVYLDYSGWKSIPIDLKRPDFLTESFDKFEIDTIIFGLGVSEGEMNNQSITIGGLFVE